MPQERSQLGLLLINHYLFNLRVELIQSNRNELILRRGQSMALNNDGDTVELLSPGGQVVDTVTYSSTSPDVTIFF